MTCKDCVHYDVCLSSYIRKEYPTEVGYCEENEICHLFKDKSKFIELPCKVGDTVYVIPSKVNYDLNKLNRHSENNRVYEQTVDEVRMFKNGNYLLTTCHPISRRPSGLRKTNLVDNSLAHRTTWLRSDLAKIIGCMNKQSMKCECSKTEIIC